MRVPAIANTDEEDVEIIQQFMCLFMALESACSRLNLYFDCQNFKEIIVKFQSQKAKARMYKERTKLKHIRVSDLYPDSTTATRVESGRIYLNENLTSYRRDILKRANHMRKDGLLTSAWSMDGKIYLKTSPDGNPIRMYEKSDLENL